MIPSSCFFKFTLTYEFQYQPSGNFSWNCTEFTDWLTITGFSHSWILFPYLGFSMTFREVKHILHDERLIPGCYIWFGFEVSVFPVTLIWISHTAHLLRYLNSLSVDFLGFLLNLITYNIFFCNIPNLLSQCTGSDP